MTNPKITDRQSLAQQVAQLKAEGKKVVFTNGCFDLLHVGHIDLLEKARAAGDFLIVGLNSDASVRRLKGQTRPIHSEEARARVLAALNSVDAVVIFE
ncbi:D-glycero-beta-D-manno-heptose 1-phosphate adenylyltransferase, partial [bacterium]